MRYICIYLSILFPLEFQNLETNVAPPSILVHDLPETPEDLPAEDLSQKPTPTFGPFTKFHTTNLGDPILLPGMTIYLGTLKYLKNIMTAL